MIQFVVHGLPAPQGSKVKTRYGMREDNPNTKPWRNAVAAEASEHMDGEPLTGPVALDVAFCFPRPKSHYRSGSFDGQLKSSAPNVHTNKPDLDKLLRAVGDALTGIVLRDDSQIVNVTARKRYGRPHAVVTVFPLNAQGGTE